MIGLVMGLFLINYLLLRCKRFLFICYLDLLMTLVMGQEANINSQLWLNGTTSITRNGGNNSMSINFNQPWHDGIPIFNYTSAFNILRSIEANRIISKGVDVGKNSKGGECKISQECEDDKIQLDFLLTKTTSLEIEFEKVQSLYNFTINQLQQCKTNELVASRRMLKDSNGNKL